MRYYSQELEQNQKALFIFKKRTPIVDELLESLRSKSLEIFAAQKVPTNYQHYSYIFFFETIPSQEFLNKKASIPVVILWQRKLPGSVERLLEKNSGNFKVILTGIHLNDQDIEAILWFTVSNSKESFLNISSSLKKRVQDDEVSKKAFQNRKPLSKKQFFIRGIMLLVIFEILFLFPLFGSLFFMYRGISYFKKADFVRAEKNLIYSKPFLNSANGLYTMSRPILSFFSLALLPDTIISLSTDTYKSSQIIIDIHKRLNRDLSYIVGTDSSTTMKSQIKTDLAMINRDLVLLKATTTTIDRNLESLPFDLPTHITSQIDNAQTLLAQIQKMSIHLDTILGGKEFKRYVVFFYNNMEIRPGGGFIGSFATIEFKDYRMRNLQVYDVYDADGQLKVHIEPPTAIRDYLGQPDWFLRDSNFAPDFPENVKTAESFLKREMGFENFDGAVGITTTAIESILSQFGTLYLPDYKENIDKNNFYIKTQIHAERDFFPGSTKKKNFLSTLLNTMLLRIENVNKIGLLRNISDQFDSRQIVAYFVDKSIEKTIEEAQWDGRMLVPECINKKNHCIVNSLFPVEANLGVNKANFFVSRTMEIQTTINEDGTINNIFTVNLKNDSPSNSFPGGMYKNFFRLYLPRNSTIKHVIYNGREQTNFQELGTSHFKIVAFLMETGLQTKDTFSVAYELNTKIKLGQNTLQLTLQKQIGSSDPDIHVQFVVPKNISVLHKNFPAVANSGTISYNTTLSGNKIFIINLFKK